MADTMVCIICQAEIPYGEARHGYYLARSGFDGMMCPHHGQELDDAIDKFAIDYIKKLLARTNNAE